jgi:hypothetical protein
MRVSIRHALCAISVVAFVAASTVVVAAAPAGAAPPTGYVVVSGASVIAATGVQSAAQVTCPGKTKPIGGGVFIDSGDLRANVNSSYPLGKASWAGEVTNDSGSSTSFYVQAVCVTRPTGSYSVQSRSFTAAAMKQTHDTVSCPAGSVVMGGGAFSASGSSTVNIASDVPQSSTTWWIAISSAQTFSTSFTIYAICHVGVPAGYARVSSPTVVNGAGQETVSSYDCPGISVPISGGPLTGTKTDQINMNTSIATSTGWEVYENNSSSSNANLTTVGICAGT